MPTREIPGLPQDERRLNSSGHRTGPIHLWADPLEQWVRILTVEYVRGREADATNAVPRRGLPRQPDAKPLHGAARRSAH
jgi:hypothetical protein